MNLTWKKKRGKKKNKRREENTKENAQDTVKYPDFVLAFVVYFE